MVGGIPLQKYHVDREGRGAVATACVALATVVFNRVSVRKCARVPTSSWSRNTPFRGSTRPSAVKEGFNTVTSSL